jgi:hypothetical protein
MPFKILIIALMLVIGLRPAHAQSPRPVRAVAVIESIYADSAGHPIRHGRPMNIAQLDSLLTSFKNTVGATVWFSWSGGPKQPRTSAQNQLLARLRASGIRVELRTDSTAYSQVVRP